MVRNLNVNSVRLKLFCYVYKDAAEQRSRFSPVFLKLLETRYLDNTFFCKTFTEFIFRVEKDVL